MNPKIQKAMPIVLTIASSMGVIATSYLVAKETEANIDKLQDSKKDKKLYFRNILKVYAPAFIVGTATITSMTAGTIIGKKTEASLSATCIMLDQSLRKYKGKVKEKLGEKAGEIEKSIMKDELKLNKNNEVLSNENGYRLYYEEHIGFFKAKPEDFQAAITKMNERILTKECYCSLKLFIEDMHAILCDKNIDKVSYDYGWSSEYLNETYLDEGYNCFVHVNTKPCVDENGEVEYFVISFDKEPIFGISEWIKYSDGYTAAELEKMQEKIDNDAEMRMREYSINNLKQTNKLSEENDEK